MFYWTKRPLTHSCMKVSSYVVTHDYGFAPNPYGGVLTLATCKPKIRRFAAPNSWVIGTGSTKGIGTDRLIFAGFISDVITIEQYSTDEDYKIKIPTRDGEVWQTRGDNIYYKNHCGQWQQRENPFHGKNEIEHDLSGENVVVCKRFWYFGRSAPSIPDKFRSVIKSGPNHKANINNKYVPEFLSWVQSYEEGIHAMPSNLMA